MEQETFPCFFCGFLVGADFPVLIRMFKSPLYSAMTDETSVALLLINLKHACDNNFVEKAVDSFTLQGLMEFI